MPKPILESRKEIGFGKTFKIPQGAISQNLTEISYFQICIFPKKAILRKSRKYDIGQNFGINFFFLPMLRQKTDFVPYNLIQVLKAYVTRPGASSLVPARVRMYVKRANSIFLFFVFSGFIEIVSHKHRADVLFFHTL